MESRCAGNGWCLFGLHRSTTHVNRSRLTLLARLPRRRKAFKRACRRAEASARSFDLLDLGHQLLEHSKAFGASTGSRRLQGQCEATGIHVPGHCFGGESRTCFIRSTSAGPKTSLGPWCDQADQKGGPGPGGGCNAQLCRDCPCRTPHFKNPRSWSFKQKGMDLSTLGNSPNECVHISAVGRLSPCHLRTEH